MRHHAVQPERQADPNFADGVPVHSSLLPQPQVEGEVLPRPADRTDEAGNDCGGAELALEGDFRDRAHPPVGGTLEDAADEEVRPRCSWVSATAVLRWRVSPDHR